MSMKVPSLDEYLKNQTKWDDYIKHLRRLQRSASLAFLNSGEGKDPKDWKPVKGRKQSDCICEEPETCDGYVFKDKRSRFVCDECYEHFAHKLFNDTEAKPE